MCVGLFSRGAAEGPHPKFAIFAGSHVPVDGMLNPRVFLLVLILFPTGLMAADKEPFPICNIGRPEAVPCATRPTPRKTVNIEYPDEVWKSKLAGFVTVSLIVDKKGVPHNVQASQSLQPQLDQQAVFSIEQWRFKPGKYQGRVVAVRAEMKVLFGNCLVDHAVTFTVSSDSGNTSRGRPKPMDPSDCANHNRPCPARAIKVLTPEYPKDAPKGEFEGTIVISMMVDERGNVHNAQLVQPLRKDLDEQAIVQAKEWRFRPAVYKGEPIPVHVTAEIYFGPCKKPIATPFQLQ